MTQEVDFIYEGDYGYYDGADSGVWSQVQSSQPSDLPVDVGTGLKLSYDLLGSWLIKKKKSSVCGIIV